MCLFQKQLLLREEESTRWTSSSRARGEGMMNCGEFAQSRKTGVDVRPPARPICTGNWPCARYTFFTLNQFLSVTLGFPQHLSLSNPVLLARTQWPRVECWVSTHFAQGCRVRMHRSLWAALPWYCRAAGPRLTEVAGLGVDTQRRIESLTPMLSQLHPM